MAVLTHEHRVIFGDTDAMGIVYHGNYFRYFELARGEWFREFYKKPTDMVEAGHFLIVIAAHANYIYPARYDDVLQIEAWIPKDGIGRVQLRFEFEIFRRRDRKLLVDGYTTHTWTDKNGKLKRLSKQMIAELSDLTEDRRIENGE